MAGRDDLRSALIGLGLLGSRTTSYRTTVGSGWTKAGAETYILDFSVEEGGRQTRALFKACVALGSLGGVESELDEWIRRRRILAGAGISVPYLYGRTPGTILEEYVPFELLETLGAVDAWQRRHLAAEMGQLAAVIDRLMFPALSLDDLRSRGDDVVVVDFGEDLGPPAVGPPNGDQALTEVLRLAAIASLSDAEQSEVIQAYKRGRNL